MKKILMYRWSAYNYTDIKAHFEAFGFEVLEIEKHLESYDEDEELYHIMQDELSRGGFSFVFTVNYFGVIAELCQDMGITYVSWSCDSPLISMHHESVFYDTNRIFLFDFASFVEFKEMGMENVYYLPLCVDTDRINEVLKSAQDLSSYKNQISFVGNLYERNTFDRVEAELSDYLRGYLEAVIQIQSENFGQDLIEPALTPNILSHLEESFNLNKSSGSFSDIGLVFSSTVLGFKAAAQSRITALNELSKKYNIGFYTNSKPMYFSRIIPKGSLEYVTELPRLFKASDINLNFTIPNIKTGIPLRVWDIMGSGGFMITSWSRELELYFKDGEDIVSFKSLPELYEKVDYYIDKPELRARIADQALKKIQKNHTYKVRLGQMLEELGAVKRL